MIVNTMRMIRFILAFI